MRTLSCVVFSNSCCRVGRRGITSPTAAEKAALDKYLAALNPVLDQFQGDD